MSRQADTAPVDVGNPISIIKNKIHKLRAEKDATEADIESLQHEKASIRQTLPKLLHVLIQHRDNIYAQQREIDILDKAIEDIEHAYGHILYSPDFYGTPASSRAVEIKNDDDYYEEEPKKSKGKKNKNRNKKRNQRVF